MAEYTFDDVQKMGGSEYTFDQVRAMSNEGFSPVNMVKNVPKSAANFAGGLWQAVTNPIDTVTTLADAAAGGLRNLVPNRVRSAIDTIDWNPQAADRATATADAVGQVYKDRYGGARNILSTIENDPVGAAADLSTVLGLGGGAARAVGLTKPADVLSKAASVTNPVNAAVQVGSKAADLGGKAAAYTIGGLGTHTGGRTLTEAYQAGKAGGTAQDALTANMRGTAAMDAALDTARQGLQNMRNEMMSKYLADKKSWANNPTPLDFKPIEQAFSNVVGSMRQGNHWKVGGDELKTVKEIADVLDEFRKDPTSHTALGFDALKQRIDAIYPASQMHTQAQRAVTATRNSVKDSIVKQSPDYADAMRSYEKAAELQNEITRALSLGDRASKDTALRKLQSVTRNNANTNYGNRVGMVEALQSAGGTDIMPALAGQALSSWMPRGLGTAVGGATLAASATNPAWLAALPIQSPRLMGEAALLAGKGARVGGGLLGDIYNPALAQYLGQAGLLSQPELAR